MKRAQNPKVVEAASPFPRNSKPGHVPRAHRCFCPLGPVAHVHVAVRRVAVRDTAHPAGADRDDGLANLIMNFDFDTLAASIFGHRDEDLAGQPP